MNVKNRFTKILTTFIATIITLVFSSGWTKAVLAHRQAPTQPSLEERLAQVREQIRTSQRLDEEQFELEQSNSEKQTAAQPSRDGDGSGGGRREWNNWNNWKNDWNDWDNKPKG